MQKIQQILKEQRGNLIEKVIAKSYEISPEIEKYEEEDRLNFQKDLESQLSYLREAILYDRPFLFSDYIKCNQTTLTQRKISTDRLMTGLKSMREILKQHLSREAHSLVCHTIEEGIKQLSQASSELPSFINEENPYFDLAQQYLSELLRGKRHISSQLIKEAVEKETPIKDIYLYIFQPTQYEIGRLWQMNRINVAEEHYCTASTQLIMSQLYPYIFNSEKNGLKLVITCISDELHEIGPRMIADFFEMEGWDTYYLGANTPISDILQTIGKQQPDILGISTTLTPHIRKTDKLIRAIRKNAHNVKIMVGGYPFNSVPDLWKQVKADACASNALDALRISRQLVKKE